MHARAPAAEKAPREQLLQAAAAVAPKVGLNFPAGHKLQLVGEDAPVISLKVPTAQATGATDPMGQKNLLRASIRNSRISSQ